MQEAVRRCYQLAPRAVNPEVLSRVCDVARQILAKALVNAAELLLAVLAINARPPAAPLQPPDGASHCCSPLASSAAASTSSSSSSSSAEGSQSPPPPPRPAPAQPQPLPPAPESSEESHISVKLLLRGMQTLSRQPPLPTSRKRRRADPAEPSAEDDTVPKRGPGHAHSVREVRANHSQSQTHPSLPLHTGSDHRPKRSMIRSSALRRTGPAGGAGTRS